MFSLYEPERHRVPIKVWLEDESQLDSMCRQQAENLASLPFAFRQIALMPDTHTGFGMPIGGVLAAADVLVPNAVGVDIGCGVAFLQTDASAALLDDVQTSRGSLGRALAQRLLEEIPTGFQHHKERQPCPALDKAASRLHAGGKLPDLDEGYYQIGTLGGGNHFIELQEDDEGRLAIMVHSGSRNFGYKTARYFNDRAKALRSTQRHDVPPEYDLAALDADSSDGRAYRDWLQLCLDFAHENRAAMLERTRRIVFEGLQSQARVRPEVLLQVQAHHNYAALEEHFGRQVWVHRKGAIAAGRDQWGIIPGAMGSYSFITKGLGSPESFESSSHGAGRTMGRREALRRFSREEVLQDLDARGVVLGKKKKGDTAEEYRLAYKNISEVMAMQQDLAKPVLRLRTKVVIKG